MYKLKEDNVHFVHKGLSNFLSQNCYPIAKEKIHIIGFIWKDVLQQRSEMTDTVGSKCVLYIQCC